MSRNGFFSIQTTGTGVQIYTSGTTPAESLMLAREATAKALCVGTQRHGQGLLGILNFAAFTARDPIEDLKQIYTKNGGGCFAIPAIFGDKPSFETAWNRIAERSRKNSGGASSKTINALAVQIQPQPSRTPRL